MKNEEIVQRIQQLGQSLEKHPTDDQLYLERGHLYWKLQDWKHCLEDFDQAIRLNPQSPAVEMRRMLTDVIEFYYKDQYNP